MGKLKNEKRICLIDHGIKSLSNISLNEQLTELILHSNEIKSLDGIKMAVNLEYLDLSSNFLEDIKLLNYLFKLTYLNLSCNNIKNIPKLNNLVKLTTLDLSYNEIKTLYGIKDMDIANGYNLETLNLQGNIITSLPHIIECLQFSGIKYLKIFDVESNIDVLTSNLDEKLIESHKSKLSIHNTKLNIWRQSLFNSILSLVIIDGVEVNINNTINTPDQIYPSTILMNENSLNQSFPDNKFKPIKSNKKNAITSKDTSSLKSTKKSSFADKKLDMIPVKENKHAINTITNIKLNNYSNKNNFENLNHNILHTNVNGINENVNTIYKSPQNKKAEIFNKTSISSEIIFPNEIETQNKSEVNRINPALDKDKELILCNNKYIVDTMMHDNDTFEYLDKSYNTISNNYVIKNKLNSILRPKVRKFVKNINKNSLYRRKLFGFRFSKIRRKMPSKRVTFAHDIEKRNLLKESYLSILENMNSEKIERIKSESALMKLISQYHIEIKNNRKNMEIINCLKISLNKLNDDYKINKMFLNENLVSKSLLEQQMVLKQQELIELKEVNQSLIKSNQDLVINIQQGIVADEKFKLKYKQIMDKFKDIQNSESKLKEQLSLVKNQEKIFIQTINDAKGVNLTLTNNIKTLENNLKIHVSDKQSMQSQLEENKNILNELQDKYMNLIKEFGASIEIEKENENNLKKELKEKSIQVSKLNNIIRTKNKEIEEAKTTYQNKFDSLTNQLNEAKKRFKNSKFKEQEILVESMKNEVIKINEINEHLNLELSKQKNLHASELSEINAKLLLSIEQHSIITKDRDEQCLTLQIKEKVINDLNDSLQKYKIKVQSNEEKNEMALKELQKINDELKKQLVFETTNHDKTKYQLREMHSVDDTSQEEIISLKEKLNVSKRNYNFIKNQLQDKCQEIENIEKQVIDIIENQKNKEMKLNNEKNNAQETVASLNQEITNLKCLYTEEKYKLQAMFDEKLIQKNRDLKMANIKIVQIENEMRDMLIEFNKAKQNDEDKIKKILIASNFIKQQLT